MPSITTEELRKVIALKDLPEPHLQWILDHGEYMEYEDGAVLSKTGEPIDYMWLVIEGEAIYYQDVNGRLVRYYTFENNQETGGVGGLLPFSRMKAAQGYTYVSGTCRAVMLHKKYFHELEQLNPEFVQQLIGYMTGRARVFATLQLQQEKVAALGKLAAGIAHELNNPASAITRIAVSLRKNLKLNYDLTEDLLLQPIDPAQVEILRERTIAYAMESATHSKMTALEKFEKEMEMESWLDRYDQNEAGGMSDTFVTAGWSIDDFETLWGIVGPPSFLPVLRWLENLITAGWLLTDLEEASNRISLLVGSLKSHVHMDRTHARIPTNIHLDIDNTLVLLGYKIREKHISVQKTFADPLPDIEAYVGELNQVWSNLLDNAIYAMDPGGILTIETARDDNFVVVRIIDNGRGIPPEVLPHIFEPYFTTKQAGDGSGIGLDIVNRVIRNHHGSIHVTSVPGRTEFIVRLPVVSTVESVKHIDL